MKNALLGLAVAAAVSLAVVNPVIFGIDAWKIVLGIAGLLMIRAAGRDAGPAGKA